MKVFVDTNVLLDLMCQREGFSRAADAIFERCVEGAFDIVVSSLTLINANYTARRYGYSRDELVNVFKRLLHYVSISSVDADVFVKALYSGRPDLEDAVQYYSAKSVGVDCIITRDKKGFAGIDIHVLTPVEFLELISQDV